MKILIGGKKISTETSSNYIVSMENKYEDSPS